MNVNGPVDLTSIGKLASEVQTPVSGLQNVITRLSIQPVQRINGVPYFSAQDCERIAAQLRAAQGSRLSSITNNLH
tara:strand:+ start:279 stop:506 length:228 start_codon:yes stop_codon:yes gene_type:complete